MRFMFNKCIFKQGKQVYQGNHLQGKRTSGHGMERIQMQWQGRKGSPLARIARKRDMMRKDVGSYIPRRCQSGSRKRREGKQW
jgi:hypothetical protein